MKYRTGLTIGIGIDTCIDIGIGIGIGIGIEGGDGREPKVETPWGKFHVHYLIQKIASSEVGGGLGPLNNRN
jgi:hypothetical protein